LARSLQSRGYKQRNGSAAWFSKEFDMINYANAQRVAVSFFGALVFAAVAISAAVPVLPIV
jgi:hypothetical protein